MDSVIKNADCAIKNAECIGLKAAYSKPTKRRGQVVGHGLDK